MYTEFFRLRQAPFSISPDPRYLFMSERHREALAHLLYGIDSGGGLVLLTGDIGTGKTTICRCFLEQVPANCNVAYIFNPKLSVAELLQSICEEFHIPVAERERHSVKDYIDALNGYLLASHAEGRNNVLIIDEAQNLSPKVLEQLRLLTNLETNERKLLQIILIGQPELRAMLAQPELEQLAQRVIAHYHLTALSEEETASYIQHRLSTAGLASPSPFRQSMIRQIHRLTGGVPRRINLLCDRAMLGAYAKGLATVDRDTIAAAGAELFINQRRHAGARMHAWHYPLLGALAGVIILGVALITANAGALRVAAEDGWARVASLMSRETPVPAPKDKNTDGNAAQPKAAQPAMPTSANAADDSKGQPATASAPGAPQRLFAEHDGSPLGTALDENAAIRQLAAYFSSGLPEKETPCDSAGQAGLRCYWSTRGFGEIRSIDRPVAIRLEDNQKRSYYVVLSELRDTEATLHAGDLSQNVPLSVLGRYFHGEFVTLWRMPPGFEGPVKPGDRGPAVDWLAQRLAKINGVEAPPAGAPYGPGMVRQVGQFQQAHGLHVDGIVGPVTAIHINRASGIEEPRLGASPRAGRESANAGK
ncbi:AAA family ATPase [Noviherbaspirillum sp. CPCC 100848]|uniref:AAA family ATPase n=1 Tax=Noviherbaspirillum album TaxID=3080276 RepID=A0ABU6J4D1_9BURK|nr:AAA family ATPase [Noviherbaspirillum sp. CPCC 100848]MEC4718487.1 AAA family ATPase [Noviherbaspirillum sp. CPCC 100848]